MRNKKENEPLPVYIVTKTGTGYNDEGIRDVTEFVLTADTSGAGPQGYGIDGDTTGILAVSGAHLLDPVELIRNLDGNPAARVIVATRNDGSYTLAPYGPEDDGLSAVKAVLREAASDGETSHKALVRALRPDLMEELYSEV